MALFIQKHVPVLGINFLSFRLFSKSSVILRKVPDPGIELKEKKWQLEFHQKFTEQMKSYPPIPRDKKPVQVTIKKGKKYAWCSCGFSGLQPFCDGSHRLTVFKTSQKPLVFIAPETKEVWFCMCKRSKNPPFCDGSHKDKEIQDKFPDRLSTVPTS